MREEKPAVLICFALPPTFDPTAHKRERSKKYFSVEQDFPCFKLISLKNFSKPRSECHAKLFHFSEVSCEVVPLSGPWTPEASASYLDLCQFGPHLASLQNGTIITFKIWDRIKDLPRYK